jgi:hypothetical protein
MALLPLPARISATRSRSRGVSWKGQGSRGTTPETTETDVLHGDRAMIALSTAEARFNRGESSGMHFYG